MPGRRKSNTLGAIAACLGVVGLLALCVPQLMVVSGLALLLGLIALFRSPRAFALLGVLLAFVGVGLGATHLLVRAAFRVTSGLVETVADRTQNNLEAMQIATAIEAYRAAKSGELPASLSVLALPLSTSIDAWGESYVYTVSPAGTTYSLISKGPDRVLGNDDDINLTSVVSLESSLRDIVPQPPRPPALPQGWGLPSMPATRAEPQQHPEKQAEPVRSKTPGPA